MLPAIVVLRITVDENGGLDDVAVQRSRDDDASQIALDSMRRSSPLPPPRQLAQAGGKLTFSETFLFADSGRYQLRSLAAPQTDGLMHQLALGRCTVAARRAPAGATPMVTTGAAQPCRVTSNRISSSRRKACTSTTSPTR